MLSSFDPFPSTRTTTVAGATSFLLRDPNFSQRPPPPSSSLSERRKQSASASAVGDTGPSSSSYAEATPPHTTRCPWMYPATGILLLAGRDWPVTVAPSLDILAVRW